MEHESDGDASCNRCARYSHLMIDTRTRRIGNRNTSGDHSNDSTVKIGPSIEKCPGDLRRLAFTQTLVKDTDVKYIVF